MSAGTLSEDLMAEQQAREAGAYRPGGMHMLVVRAATLEAEVVQLRKDAAYWKTMYGDAQHRASGYNSEAGAWQEKAEALERELEDTKAQLKYVRKTVRVQEEVARALEDEIAQLCAQREARRP